MLEGAETTFKMGRLVTMVGYNIRNLLICVGCGSLSKFLEYEQMEIGLLWHLLLEKGAKSEKHYFMQKGRAVLFTLLRA